MDGSTILPRHHAGAVALGAAVGVSLRWFVAARFPLEPGSLPWRTLLVNVVGSLAIGVAAARLVRGSFAWSFVATGVLGGFTTMSSLAWELNDLADRGESTAVVLYLAATLAGAHVALLLGGRAAARPAADVRNGGDGRSDRELGT